MVLLMDTEVHERLTQGQRQQQAGGTQRDRDGRSRLSDLAAYAGRQQQRLQQQQQQQQAECCRSNGKAPRNGKGERAQAALRWLHGNDGRCPKLGRTVV